MILKRLSCRNYNPNYLSLLRATTVGVLRGAVGVINIIGIAMAYVVINPKSSDLFPITMGIHRAK